MAEAFLQVALETLTSLIKDKVGLILGVDHEMKKLASHFTAIQAVLEDAQLNHLKSKGVEDWLIKLSDVTYDIDDILDECATHVAKSKHLPGRYFLKKMLFRHNIGRKMKEVAERLEVISAERAKFHLREMDFGNTMGNIVVACETGSVLNQPEYIFGRDDDKNRIVDILVHQVRENEKISVFPIHGVGGLGKTTLAQLLFKDPQVGKHFRKKIWVSVNDNFNLKFLMKAMIESEGKVASNLQHMDALQRCLGDLLNRQRYLLVLDDVWSYDQEKWYQLRNVVAGGAPGSAIIVTTCLRRVAEIMGTLPIYELKGLSKEHCWKLFKHRAFQCDEEGQYPNLEAIGKQIVKKCAGVPLAAKALGGLLRFKRSEREWIRVKKSEIWDLPEEETMILPVLKLSYHHLPLTLRQCFAYCGILPKNFTISKEGLIYLWMAHGYISSNENFEVEEVGEQILDELFARSLLQIKIHARSSIYITIHDLVHDLAKSIMNNKVLGSMSTSASKSRIREVTSLTSSPSTLNKIDISTIAAKYYRLRVLHPQNVHKINVLPSTLCRLKHLRLLNLSGSNIQTLPDSICNIWNLQVLILDDCCKLVVFPKKMRHLQNLRHLLFDGCVSLRETPGTISKLTSLRILSMFIVGHDKGHRLDELEFINLGGELVIQNLERVENHTYAEKANLVQKENLKILHLEWTVIDAISLREEKVEKILEALQPPPNIEDLKIRGFNGKCFPNWMGKSSLEKLTKIHISECRNLSGFPHLEELPHLKVLCLNESAIEYLIPCGNRGATCFPALEELELKSLKNLKGFSYKEDGRYMCPMLRKLDVKKCPSLILPPLNKLEELNCDKSMNVASLPILNNLKRLNASIGNNEHVPTERLPNLETLIIGGAHEECLSVD